jgi:hypothetical protein
VLEVLVVEVAATLEDPPPTLPVVVEIWARTSDHPAAAAVNNHKNFADDLICRSRNKRYSRTSMPLNVRLERIARRFSRLGSTPFGQR